MQIIPAGTRRRTIILLGSAAALAALIACGGGGGAPPTPRYDVADYFPLEAGLAWVYSDGALQYNITGTELVGATLAHVRNEFLQGPDFNEFWIMDSLNLRFAGQQDHTGKYRFEPALPVAGRNMAVGRSFGGGAEMFDEHGVSQGLVYLSSNFEGFTTVDRDGPHLPRLPSDQGRLHRPGRRPALSLLPRYLARGVGMVKYEIFTAADAAPTVHYLDPM